jgi:hypothetical protein
MFGRLHLLALVLIGALLSTAQCYAMCEVSACAVPTRGAFHCHHRSSDSNGSGQACQHYHHTDFSSPEGSTDLAKLAGHRFIGIVELAGSELSTPLATRSAATVLETFEYHAHPGQSVLARLSTFRI